MSGDKVLDLRARSRIRPAARISATSSSRSAAVMWPGWRGFIEIDRAYVSCAINLATNYAAGAGKASRSGPCDDVRCYAGDVLAQRGPEHGFHGIEGLQFSNVIPLLITIRSASTTDAVPRRYAQRWRPPCSGRSTRQVAFLWSPRCRANSAAAWRNAASRQG